MMMSGVLTLKLDDEMLFEKPLVVAVVALPEADGGVSSFS
jgi:hypothetical protein